MQPGQFILPPTVTGHRSLADYGAGAVCRRDRIYVATDFQAAALYAGMYPGKKRGCVYQVEPIGQLEHDPDCDRPDLSFSVERARIVKMFKLSRSDVALIREIMRT